MTDERMIERHDEWTDRLSEHVDGSLPPGEERELLLHLETCAGCRRTLEELHAVRAAASRLGDVPPGRDLWPGIRAALSPRRRGVFLSFPQLAAASVALILSGSAAAWAVAGVAGSGGTSGPEGAAIPAAVETAGGAESGERLASGYAAEVERLEALLASGRDRLDPSTVRVLEKNVAVIDRAIAESVAAFEADPGNAWVREHLRRSWERKVDYLREAADLLEWSSGD